MTDIEGDRDLVLERRMKARPEALWRCWTEPALLTQWFCPPPWKATKAIVEPRPGGRFFTRMEGPEGQSHEGEGCVLAAEPARLIAFTDALAGGWRPNAEPFMTAVVTFEPDGAGTLYRAVALHHDAAARTRHEEMGFHDGWGTAAAQLDALAQGLG